MNAHCFLLCFFLWYVFTNLIKKLNKSQSSYMDNNLHFIIVAYFYWGIIPGLYLTMVLKLDWYQNLPKSLSKHQAIKYASTMLLLCNSACKCKHTAFLTRYFSLFLKLLVCRIHFESYYSRSRDAQNIFCIKPEKTNFRSCRIYGLHGKQWLKSPIVAGNKSYGK